MATVVWDLERPAFLDAPPERARAPLSERLRSERVAMAASAPAAQRKFAGPRRGGEATFDDVVVGAWEGLSARRSVACPVCSGSLTPHTDAVGGGCSDCGAALS